MEGAEEEPKGASVTFSAAVQAEPAADGPAADAAELEQGRMRSYPYRPPGAKFNESKGPQLFACVSPTLGDFDAGSEAPLAMGEATFDTHVPSFNDAMNMSSQIVIDLTKHWTREDASKVKRWDAEIKRLPSQNRNSPERYNPNLRASRRDVPMGIMPLPGGAVGVELAGRHLPGRFEQQAAAAPEPEPEPEPEPRLPLPLPPPQPEPEPTSPVPATGARDEPTPPKGPSVKFQTDQPAPKPSKPDPGTIRHGRRRGRRSPTKRSHSENAVAAMYAPPASARAVRLPDALLSRACLLRASLACGTMPLCPLRVRVAWKRRPL